MHEPDAHMNEHGLDALGPRGAPAEPPAPFMAAVRRRHRRTVNVRAAGALATTIVIAIVALAIALPAMRSSPAPTPRIAVVDRPTEIAITAASVRSFLEDPGILDRPIPAGPPAPTIRAGDRPDSEPARSLLTFN